MMELLAGLTGIKRYLAIGAAAIFMASLLGNVVSVIALKHYVSSAASCKTAVTATKQAAEKTQRIVQTREVKNVQTSQVAVNQRLNTALARLQYNQSRVGNMSVPVPAPGGAQSDGGAPVVLPRELTDEEKNDQRICVTNTILLEGWQGFYQKQLDTFAEELDAFPTDIKKAP